MYRETAKFVSHRLQEQTDYFKELADCDNPVKLLNCNGEFVRRTLANSTEDAQSALAALQRSYSGVSGI
jgi:hypothetical protein